MNITFAEERCCIIIVILSRKENKTMTPLSNILIIYTEQFFPVAYYLANRLRDYGIGIVNDELDVG